MRDSVLLVALDDAHHAKAQDVVRQLTTISTKADIDADRLPVPTTRETIWPVATKYYTADIRLVVLPEAATVAQHLEQADAVVLVVDRSAPLPTDLKLLLEAVENHDPALRLFYDVAAAAAPTHRDYGSAQGALPVWCQEQSLELVHAELPLDDALDLGFEEPDLGVGRLAEALTAHMWEHMAPVEASGRASAAVNVPSRGLLDSMEIEAAASADDGSTEGESESDEPHDALLQTALQGLVRMKQQTDVVRAMEHEAAVANAAELAQTDKEADGDQDHDQSDAEDDTEDDEEFDLSNLADALRQIRESSQHVPDEQRRHRAAVLAAALAESLFGGSSGWSDDEGDDNDSPGH